MTGRPATAQHVRDLARPRRVRNRTGPAKKTTATKGWTAEERAAAKAYAQERKAEARGENDEGTALVKKAVS